MSNITCWGRQNVSYSGKSSGVTYMRNAFGIQMNITINFDKVRNFEEQSKMIMVHKNKRNNYCYAS